MPKPKITSAMELEALVQQMGFLPFFPCSIPTFSIKEFTPNRYWFAAGVDGPWEWRVELARREWYPDLANYFSVLHCFIFPHFAEEKKNST